MDPPIDAVFVSCNNSVGEALMVYDVDTGAVLKSYRGSQVSFATLCTIGLCDYLLTAQKDTPLLQAWSLHRHDSLQLRLVVPGPVRAMAVNKVGPKYCVLGIGEQIYIYELLSGVQIGVATYHYQPITRIKFSICGNFFATAGEEGFVYIWNIAAFVDALHRSDRVKVEPHFVLGQHSDKATDICFAGTGMRGSLLSCSSDQTCYVFDLVTGRQLSRLVTESQLSCVAVNNLGSLAFLGTTDGHILPVNMLPSLPVGDVQLNSHGVECHTKCVTCLSVRSSDNLLISGSDDGEIKIWTVINSGVSGSGHTKSSGVTLAVQKTISIGKGSITNVEILHVDRQIFSAMELVNTDLLSPFITHENNAGILSSSVTVKTRNVLPVSNKFQSDISDYDRSNYEKMNLMETKNENLEDGNSEILKENLQEIQRTNFDLYKFALKQILKE